MKASFSHGLSGCLLSLLIVESCLTASAKALEIEGVTYQPKISGAKIVGGEEVGRGFPWMAYVAIGTGGNMMACGGSLINNQWILTAAHCLNSISGSIDVNDGSLPPGLITAFLGVYDLNNFVELSSTANSVTRAFAHPNFDVTTFDNDFALLQLAAPVTNTPVQLLESADFQETLNALGDNGFGPLLTVAGWGRVFDGGPSSNLLQTVDLPLIAPSLCVASPYSMFVADPAFCAGFPEGGKDSCQGDSGGPIYGFHGGNVVQVGVVSYGNGCAVPNNPGVYADVTQRIDWIRDRVGNFTLAPDLDEVFDTSSSSSSASSRRSRGGFWSIGLSLILMLLVTAKRWTRSESD